MADSLQPHEPSQHTSPPCPSPTPRVYQNSSTESVMPSNHLILYCPLLLLTSVFPSIRVFPNESALRIRWPKYWSFSFNISPPNEYSWVISFRMDWLDLLAVQGTLKSLFLSHASKVMLKFLQARLQQYMNHELPDVQAGFRKGKGMRDQIAKVRWIIKKAKAFQKNIYFCFIDYAKAFDCGDHNKLWEILKEMGIPDHLTCLLRKCMQVRKQQLELDMKQQTGSK